MQIFLSIDSTVSSIQATIIHINTKLQTLIASGIPTGCIIIWSGSSDNIPTGWALCNGENDTPDLRNRFVLGSGGKYGVGSKGGEENHTLTINEMPSHNHTVNVDIISRSGGFGAGGTYGTDYTTSSTGGSSPHNNMPPYYALCYIMKL